MADVSAPNQRPLIRQLGLQAVLERDKAASATTQITELAGDLLESALAGHVRLAWQRNKLAKWRMDEILLRCLRARRGVYSPAEQAEAASNGGMNIIWAPLTETKCRAASAWIREIVLPAGEQPWGIDPEPAPDLPMPLKKSIVSKAIQQAQAVMTQTQQAGGGVMSKDDFHDTLLEIGDRLKDDAEQAIVKIAQERAKRMEATIGDRLDDGGYTQAMDNFVEDFCTFPAAILKGPIYEYRKSLEWGDDFTPKVVYRPVQCWKNVRPFDFYPAAASATPQKGDMIERLRFRRDELFDCKDLPGWKNDQIDGALRDYTNGHLEGWLWTESERQRLEQQTTFMWLAPPGVIDAISYWGSIPGWKLMTWGLAEADGESLEETREYECNVVVCGRYVLYAALNPNLLGHRPYHKACYDEIPGSFWGRAIPDLIRTCQQLCNAAVSAMADNLSIASGPQIWVYADRFADGEQTLEQMPWKIWQLKSDPSSPANPGIGQFQPNDNSDKLMKVYDAWEVKSDDASGIPKYTYSGSTEGMGGATDTATGLTTLMNNAAKGLRRAISNIDLNVIAPTVYDAYVHEMLYNPDASIKGACNVVPRGAAAILIRESAQQRRLQFLSLTANPIDAPIIGPKHRGALLREVAQALDLPVDDVVPTDDEIQQNMVMMQQQQAQQQQAVANMQAQKEAAIAQRETAGQQTKAIAGIVTAAIAKHMPASAGAAGAPQQGM
jgi:hypothetical protein